MSSEKYLTRKEAAAYIGKSEPTLDLYLKANRYPNAKRVKEPGKRGGWQIPFSDLVAAGDIDSVTSEPPKVISSGTQLMTLQEQINAKEQLAALRVEVEQLRERLADLQQARADLIAAYAPQIETAQKQAERRRWWQRTGSNGSL